MPFINGRWIDEEELMALQASMTPTIGGYDRGPDADWGLTNVGGIYGTEPVVGGEGVTPGYNPGLDASIINESMQFQAPGMLSPTPVNPLQAFTEPSFTQPLAALNRQATGSFQGEGDTMDPAAINAAMGPQLAGPTVNQFRPTGSDYTPQQLSTPVEQLQQQNIPSNVVPIDPTAGLAASDPNLQGVTPFSQASTLNPFAAQASIAPQTSSLTPFASQAFSLPGRTPQAAGDDRGDPGAYFGGEQGGHGGFESSDYPGLFPWGPGTDPVTDDQTSNPGFRPGFGTQRDYYAPQPEDDAGDDFFGDGDVSGDYSLSSADINAAMSQADYDPYGGIGTGGGMVDPTWGGQGGHVTTDLGGTMLGLGLPGIGLTGLGGKGGIAFDPSKRDFMSKSAKAVAAAALAALGLGPKIAKTIKSAFKSPVGVTKSRRVGDDAIEFTFEDGTKQIVKKGQHMKSVAPLTAAMELVDAGVTIDKDDLAEMISQVDTFKDIPAAVTPAPVAAPAGPSAADIQRDKQAAVDARNAAQARQEAINAQMAQEAAARQRQQQAAIAAEQARQAQVVAAQEDAARQAALARQVYADLMSGRDRGEPSAREIERAMERATQVDTFGHIGRQEQEAADRASVAIDASRRGGGPF